jgi:Domain of unknown function (DUF4397)
VRIRSATAIVTLALSSFALQTGTHAPAQGADTRIRFGHFSVDAEGVDVYIDGKKKMQRVPYQAVTDYVTVPAGKHTIEARGEGQAETGPAIFTVSPELAAGKSFTVAALGPVANVQAKVFEDDLAAPASGKSKIRVIHAADGTGKVDVAQKTGEVLFPGLDYGAISTYLEVPEGVYTLQVLPSGTKDVAFEKTVTVQPGGIYTIAALGGADKPLTVRGYIDLSGKAGSKPGVTSAATASTAPATTAPAGASTETKAPNVTTAPADSQASASSAKPAETKAKASTTIAEAPTPLPTTTVAAPLGGGGKKPTSTKAGQNPPAKDPGSGGKTPKEGVKTGFGDFNGPSGALSLAAITALFLAAIGTGLVRRRSAKR